MGEVAAGSRTTSSQLKAPLRWAERFLPKGWGDFIRQLLLFLVVDIGYELTRGVSLGNVQVAFAHGRSVISTERSLGIFTELNVQHFALRHTVALDVADFTYFHAHFVITVCFMFWLYLRRNHHYYFVRNAVFVADGIALLGFTFYPVAPPRFFTNLGFTDTLDRYASINTYSDGLKQLTNPYAAVPSIHTCYSIITGLTCFFLVRRAVPLHLAVLPGAHHLLDRGDRQPLLDGCDPRRVHCRHRALHGVGHRAVPPEPPRQRAHAHASETRGRCGATTAGARSNPSKSRENQTLIAPVV